MPNPYRPTIGYVLKRFPRLSETFVLNEILELERQGHRVEIFSLLQPPPEGRHGLLAGLRAEVTYLPSASHLRKLKLHEGLDECPTDLVTLLDGGAVHDEPLFNGKTTDDIGGLYLKAVAAGLLARRRGVDHLHAHFASDAATVALLAGRLTGLPFSFTAHARDIYHTYTSPADDNAMRRAKIRQAAFTITVSEYNRSHLCRLAPADSGRIFRLYNGVDLARFAPRPDLAEQGLIVAVGRLIEKKGFSDLIGACALLRRSGTSFRCLIVGDGPLRGALAQRIAAAKLDELVEIAGPRTQEALIGLMQRASLVVLPCVVSESGDRDGLPTVLLEAMALGLPVVTTTVSGGPEIVAQGETGLLVEANDRVALAASIESLLACPQTMRRMGEAGRRRAEQLFSLTANVTTLSAHFSRSARPGLDQLREAV